MDQHAISDHDEQQKKDCSICAQRDFWQRAFLASLTGIRASDPPDEAPLGVEAAVEMAAKDADAAVQIALDNESL